MIQETHFKKLHNVTFTNIPSPACATAHSISKNRINLARGNVAPTQNEDETDVIIEVHIEINPKLCMFHQHDMLFHNIT